MPGDSLCGLQGDDEATAEDFAAGFTGGRGQQPAGAFALQITATSLLHSASSSSQLCPRPPALPSTAAAALWGAGGSRGRERSSGSDPKLLLPARALPGSALQHPSLPKAAHLDAGVMAQRLHSLHHLRQLLSDRRCWKRYRELCTEAEPRGRRDPLELPSIQWDGEVGPGSDFTGGRGKTELLCWQGHLETREAKQLLQPAVFSAGSIICAARPLPAAQQSCSPMAGVGWAGEPAFCSSSGCRGTSFSPSPLPARQPRALPCVPPVPLTASVGQCCQHSAGTAGG